MKNKFVVEIGYEHYEIPIEYLASLLDIANNCQRLKYKSHQKYDIHIEQKPFITRAELAEVSEDETESPQTKEPMNMAPEINWGFSPP